MMDTRFPAPDNSEQLNAEQTAPAAMPQSDAAAPDTAQQPDAYPQQPAQPIYPPQQQPPVYNTMPEAPVVPDSTAQQKAKKKGIASFVLGLSALFFFFPGTSIVVIISHQNILTAATFLVAPPILGIIGIILGTKSLRVMPVGNPLAKTGRTICIVATAVVGSIFLFIFSMALASTLNRFI